MRTGRPPGYMSSFTHRRIQEYFVIRHMARTKTTFDHEWVARDTNMRDAAVLYVQLANDEEAKVIAERCWAEISSQPIDGINYANPAFWRALRCQRFLAEAFRSRLGALSSFREPMADRVYTPLAAAAKIEGEIIRLSEFLGSNWAKELRSKVDLITLKLSVETLGLLPEDRIPSVLAAALQSGDPWIRESSVNASQFLPKVRPDLAGQIWRCIAAMPEDEFHRERTRLTYAFQLASGLIDIGALIRRRVEDDRDWRWFGKWIAGTAQFWRLIPIIIWRELLLRRPNDELRPLITAQGEALADLERDKSAGLAGYRKVLAVKRWWPLAGLAVVLAAAGFIWINVMELSNSYHFGHNYAFPAFIFILEEYCLPLALAGLIAASVWIGPLFAQRNYQLIVPNEHIPKRDWKSSLRKWFGLIGSLLMLLMAGPLIALFFQGSSWMLRFFFRQETAKIVEIYALYGFLTIAALSAILLIFSFASILLKFIIQWMVERRKISQDQKQYEVLTNSDNSTRKAIAENFSRFQTENAREKFVRWLSAQGFKPRDDWPTGRPPNLGDAASSLLARLEHRWRGLDR